MDFHPGYICDYGSCAALVFYCLLTLISQREPLRELTRPGWWPSYSDFPKMLVMMLSGLVLSWHYILPVRNFLVILVPLGRMTLTNYIAQGILGTTLYMGYGFGLYQYCGGTLSIGIALVMIAIQVCYSPLVAGQVQPGSS